MMSLREIDELRGNTERLLDLCTQLARDNMTLLDRIESARSFRTSKNSRVSR